ncbi:putative RNA-directed DNA polymerase [Tanacetum coccineum]
MPIRNVTFVQPLNDVTSNKSKPIGDIGESTVKSGADVTQPVGASSFASVLQNTQAKRSVRISKMHNQEAVEGARITLPMAAVEEVSARFKNTLYGFFIGDRLAFPLVENYVKNTWAKFGLKRVMLDDEFFLFQFETKDGMEKVMEGVSSSIGIGLLMDDSTASSSRVDIAMREFKECIDEIEVMDIPTSEDRRFGVRSTYNQRFCCKSISMLQEHFLKQKAKVLWLKEGDSNSAFFHKAVKGRMSRSRIDAVTDAASNIFVNDHVADAFVSHYEVFLGQEGTTSCLNASNLFDQVLSSDMAEEMIQDVRDKEIKEALFSMGNDKSPGPDGYTAAFFKEAWDIVGQDVIKAVKEFFTNGKILKELNHTIIALIPKVHTPTRVNDYRPISCCNVLFKCISKIIANRIKNSLKIFISPNQSAFVPGRSITDNILLTLELMHNYHLDRGVPRCAFKVDIQKAYDTVDWNFLRAALTGFGFHDKMISWIMECVMSTSFFVSINGSLHGYFKGKRGLRQGDPDSPYLFTIVMEVLTLMLRRRVREAEGFTYHRFCSEMELINLCFADDLFLFAHGDVHSAKIIMDSLDEFKSVSGLTPSLPKSTAYFCNVLNHTKLAILQVMPFEEGRLPVKYLGVPLVPSRLVYKDCKELIEKVVARTNDWKNKSLSIAGRLQLVQSVISSMHVYWASVFILPTCILLDIEQIMRGFLWCQGSMKKGKSKVAWEVVCLPKDEGGLGIRRLDLFNKALMATHIWKLLTMKESLWVTWIHLHKIKDRNFWDRGKMSWAWRKVLQLCPFIRKFVWHKIGDGNHTSIWFDQWCHLSPLADFISYRDMYRAGLSSSSKVADLLATGSLVWPPELVGTYPNLLSITSPSISVGTLDKLEWKSWNGIIKPFSKKLKTQDRLSSWDVNGSLAMSCPLCESQPDSHEHLFFECSFSMQVWRHMRDLVGLSHVQPSLDMIVKFLIPMAKRRTSKSVASKLVIAASVYYIWHERNDRLFNNSKRSVDQVLKNIMSSIRLKLMSCRFKKSKAGMDLLKRWNLPDVLCS